MDLRRPGRLRCAEAAPLAETDYYLATTSHHHPPGSICFPCRYQRTCTCNTSTAERDTQETMARLLFFTMIGQIPGHALWYHLSHHRISKLAASPSSGPLAPGLTAVGLHTESNYLPPPGLECPSGVDTHSRRTSHSARYYYSTMMVLCTGRAPSTTTCTWYPVLLSCDLLGDALVSWLSTGDALTHRSPLGPPESPAAARELSFPGGARTR